MHIIVGEVEKRIVQTRIPFVPNKPNKLFIHS